MHSTSPVRTHERRSAARGTRTSPPRRRDLDRHDRTCPDRPPESHARDGENPIGTLPSHLGTREACQSLELLICQELFMTETAALAHVVFPAAAPLGESRHMDKRGGPCSSHTPRGRARRRQSARLGNTVRAALLLGTPLDYNDSKDLLKEIRSVIPGYGLLGPSPTPQKVDRAAVDRYVVGGLSRRPLHSLYSGPAWTAP